MRRIILISLMLTACSTTEYIHLDGEMSMEQAITKSKEVGATSLIVQMPCVIAEMELEKLHGNYKAIPYCKVDLAPGKEEICVYGPGVYGTHEGFCEISW